MGALEQVTQMRREGRSDEEIISALKKQGTSPKDINEALNHAQIKNAVSDVQGSYDDTQAPYPQNEQPQYPNEGYNQQQNYQDYGNYPQQDQSYNQTQVYTPQPQGQGYDQQQNYYQGYDSNQTINTDTIVEVAEQVFDEKISDISKKIDSNEEFKTLTQSRLDQLNDRLKRIEIVIDKLQAAILDKIGSYGENLDSIKKEMSMMQDSFSKTLNPLLDLSQHKSSRPSPEQEQHPMQEKEEKVSNSKKKK